MPLGYSRRTIHFTQSEKKNLGNPFRFKHITGISRLPSIVGGTVAVMFLSAAYWLFFTPQFDITTIRIEGTTALVTSEIWRSALQQQLGHLRLYSIPERNFFALSTSTLAQRLNTQLATQDIRVEKKFPHTVAVKISEKPRDTIWSSRNIYYALDGQGTVIGQIAAPAASQHTVPVVFDLSGTEVTAHDQVMTPVALSFITNKAIQNEYLKTLHPQFFIVSKPMTPDIQLKTGEGWKILFDTTVSLEDQVHALELTMKNSVPPEKRASLEYVDLRFGERVYFKYR